MISVGDEKKRDRGGAGGDRNASASGPFTYSEERFDLMIKHLNDMIAIVDARGVERYVSGSVEKITGYPAEDFIGRSGFDFLHPEDVPRIAAALQELLSRPGDTMRVEYRHRHKDGHWLHLESLATNCLEDPSIQGILMNIRDVTERRRYEDALRVSEAKFREIVENAVEGIFQATPEGQFISVNPALASMIGYDSPEAMIKDVANVGKQLYVNPEERIRYKKILEEQDTIKGFEIQHYKKDKSKIWVSINARAVKDETGKLRYYEGTIEDITTRKLAEEELQNTLEKLRKSLAGTIQVVSMTVETRDPYTAGHQRRVANLARTIAQEMGLSNDTVDNIRMAGVIHDIGKISIPAELLAKPTKLTNIEFSLIKVHPQTGFDILKDVGLPYPVAEIVFQHHERLDGSGYPQGLKGEDIPLECRILSIADAYDAMTSDRPYRQAMPHEKAVAELKECAGSQFDPYLVPSFVEILEKERI